MNQNGLPGKRCAKCGATKAFEEFPRNNRQPDGRHFNCKPCHNAQVRESRQRHGGSRNYHLKRRYGIGATEVDAMIAAQGGRCLVCGRENPEHVDHDHVTGRVRGILCFTCNGGLGNFSDDVDRLRSAATYLELAAEGERDLVERARGRARELVSA
jgi:hypothetical protein